MTRSLLSRLVAWAAPQLSALFFSPGDTREQSDTARSSFERFAIPYTFKPQLTLREAVISAAAAFLRILFGSILFGFSGVYIIQAWQGIPNILLRLIVVVSLFCIFVVSFVILMLAISALVRLVWPKPASPPSQTHKL